ncbi:MAG: hypothetical protein IJS44_00300, partial [Clostridia bacterium]|nr:hypothetical protein [Clostridia bacterium]
LVRISFLLGVVKDLFEISHNFVSSSCFFFRFVVQFSMTEGVLRSAVSLSRRLSYLTTSYPLCQDFFQSFFKKFRMRKRTRRRTALIPPLSPECLSILSPIFSLVKRFLQSFSLFSTVMQMNILEAARQKFQYPLIWG